MRWRFPIRSTTARLILLAFVLQFAVTGGVLLFVQQASQRTLQAEQRDLTASLNDELATAWQTGGRDELTALLRERLGAAHGPVPVALYIAPDGARIAGNLGAWPPVIKTNSRWRTIDLYRLGGDRPERMGVMATRLPDGSRLLTGYVVEADLHLVRVIEEAVLGALAAGIAMALVGALIIGRLMSRRIDGIAAAAHAVSEGSLAARAPTDGSGDAFDTLGRSVNAMLDRIEALISQLRMITDGLAHDLRSPVTRMKSLIERAIVETRDPPALAALERVSREAEMLLRMLSTAIQISRAEAGIGRDRFAWVDLGALVEDLAEIYGPLAENDGFSIEASAPPGSQALLHREFVSQAIGNLIENALKYAEGGSHITLTATEARDTLVLAVTDDGPGIPEPQRAEAIKRFNRLDPARHLAGAGLGLSLVEAIVRLHGGELVLADNTPGLRVEMRLTRSAR